MLYEVITYRLFLFGGMVSGVSHEVDNHLSVVLGFAELSRMPGGNAEKMSENAGKIFAAGERIASIVKTFSHHARPHSPADETFLLRDLVSELMRFARYDLCRGNVSLRIGEDLPASILRGDARDLGLALLAVLFNGAESVITSYSIHYTKLYEAMTISSAGNSPDSSRTGRGIR